MRDEKEKRKMRVNTLNLIGEYWKEAISTKKQPFLLEFKGEIVQNPETHEEITFLEERY